MQERLSKKQGQRKNRDNYYPFGLTHAGGFNRVTAKDNNYLYNGKELQTDLDLDWYDYGARHYDAAIARFFTQDRFASEFSEWSPYHYANNTPINAIDINGDSTILIGWNNWVSDFNRNFHSGLQARLSDPSILLDDVITISENTLQTLGDLTGISNATGHENETAASLEVGFNTLLDIPNMSDEEKGALLAAGSVVLLESIISKKLPTKKRLGPNDPPQRIQGPWTKGDLDRAANGQGPIDMMPQTNKAGNSMPLEVHHADNMSGSAIHEVPPSHYRTIWHQRNNQGVTPQMRSQDSKLHWQLRGQEMGNKPPER
ncbi:MAG: hypothetical protein MJA30_13110 [Cytophagales bacterium]|nr:hypothetical protein [Cytophagales bacterium]